MINFSALHESFNARNLSPEQVADSFVSSQDFENLFGNYHVVLMGPRGSGKTTLLKMLTSRGLSAWRSGEGVALREAMEFTAVYIPTDIHWQRQVTHALAQLEALPRVQRKVSESAAATNVLAAFLATLRDELVIAGKNDLERERKLASELRDEWLLGVSAPLLPALRTALAKRLNRLFLWAGDASCASDDQEALAGAPDFVHLDYLAAVKVGCALFEEIYEEVAPLKWALCFDELELAPSWLQDRLFGELRSTDERFLFRLSTSPVPSIGGVRSAAPEEDYAIVRLWPHRNKDTRSFAEALAVSRIRRATGKELNLERVFGLSPFAERRFREEYEAGSETWAVLRDVAETDPDFSSLLMRHNIDPEDLSTDDPNKYDEVLRKAKPIAYLRHAFVKVDDRGLPVRRTRKVYDLYRGADVLLDISDGNPRWLTAILSEFMPIIEKTMRDNPPQRMEESLVPPQDQSKIFRRTSQQFLGFLRTLPDSSTANESIPLGLDKLVSEIGRKFFEAIVMRKFSLNPAGSFHVDGAVPESVVRLLRVAAYQGAIVMVEPEERGLETEMRGKRFRLSYLLAPELRLPLRLYKSVPLSRCLGRGRTFLGGQEELPFTGGNENETG